MVQVFLYRHDSDNVAVRRPTGEGVMQRRPRVRGEGDGRKSGDSGSNLDRRKGAEFLRIRKTFAIDG